MTDVESSRPEMFVLKIQAFVLISTFTHTIFNGPFNTLAFL